MKRDLLAVELYTVREVAAKFRVKPRTIYRWLKSGRMMAIETPGGQWRIPGEEVRRMFESMLVNEPDPKSS